MDTTILENNKLIAEFAELEKYGENEYVYNNAIYSAEDLLYDKLWDWLMPVVEKIESLGFLCQLRPRIFKVLFQGNNTAPHGEGDTRIEATYDGVIEFIKWYNQQKTA